jgi:hypothetical protein
MGENSGRHRASAPDNNMTTWCDVIESTLRTVVSQFEISIASFAAVQNPGSNPRSSGRATDAVDPPLTL